MQLKQLRTSKKMLQKDVAALLGIDRTPYVKYESGSSEPNYETLLKLAEIFGVSTDYILGRDEKKPAPISESELDAELIERLCNLTPEEKAKVDAFVQGLLASRSD